MTAAAPTAFQLWLTERTGITPADQLAMDTDTWLRHFGHLSMNYSDGRQVLTIPAEDGEDRGYGTAYRGHTIMVPADHRNPGHRKSLFIDRDGNAHLTDHGVVIALHPLDQGTHHGDFIQGDRIEVPGVGTWEIVLPPRHALHGPTLVRCEEVPS